MTVLYLSAKVRKTNVMKTFWLIIAMALFYFSWQVLPQHANWFASNNGLDTIRLVINFFPAIIILLIALGESDIKNNFGVACSIVSTIMSAIAAACIVSLFFGQDHLIPAVLSTYACLFALVTLFLASFSYTFD